MSKPLAIVLLLVLAVLAKEATGAGHAEPHKFAVKTIQSEDGDIIDCVDVYKQPSLEHLSLENLKNRSHQVAWSAASPTSGSGTYRRAAPFQTWQRSGRCPPNTVPILRHPSNGNLSNLLAANGDSKGEVERAIAYAREVGPFHGASAEIDVWSVDVMPQEYSMSAITMATSRNAATYNFSDVKFSDLIRAGVMVNPKLFGDGRLRLFAQWSNDGGATTGCFNLQCKGFVQTSSGFALGSTISKLSIYNDTAHEYFIKVALHLDDTQPRWNLFIQGEKVGYWPINVLFPGFYNVPFVTWGGEVLNTWPAGQHTSTQMGNGHEPYAGPGRTAMFHRLITRNYWNEIVDYEPLVYADRPGCYDVHFLGETWRGYQFAYGGPGGPFCAKS